MFFIIYLFLATSINCAKMKKHKLGKKKALIKLGGKKFNQRTIVIASGAISIFFILLTIFVIRKLKSKNETPPAVNQQPTAAFSAKNETPPATPTQTPPAAPATASKSTPAPAAKSKTTTAAAASKLTPAKSTNPRTALQIALNEILNSITQNPNLDSNEFFEAFLEEYSTTKITEELKNFSTDDLVAFHKYLKNQESIIQNQQLHTNENLQNLEKKRQFLCEISTEIGKFLLENFKDKTKPMSPQSAAYIEPMNVLHR